jgi:hypothetical protein
MRQAIAQTLPALGFFFVLALCAPTALRAQQPERLLLQLQPGATPAILQQQAAAQRATDFQVVKQVSRTLNAWEIRSANAETCLQWLNQQRGVRLAQHNHTVENRENTLPDDPLLSLQWHLQNNNLPGNDLGASAAWAQATGGLSPAGDTIVIAVIDRGISATHPDLAANLWRNHADIPGDGLDNDLNGYTDDHRGWNVWTQTDAIEGNSTAHGTPVSAVIGARGNDGTGISGINWHVKIMFVAAGQSESNILEAYDYILQARRRYNATQGAAGAFVVAVNCSWGTDYGQPSQAPLWCAMFDSLGTAGILSVAATANLPVNVDEVGDLPTACPSPYLIAVTSLTRQHDKAPGAAWGPTHVDCGAYGQEIFSAASTGHGVFSGTSFAAPMVSGALGLLYAADCPNLIALSKTAPAEAALLAKSAVLESAAPTPALQGITLTGGRLHLGSLLSQYQANCPPCPAPFFLRTQEIGGNYALLSWTELPDFQSINLRWRPVGAADWMQVDGAQKPFLVEKIEPCTAYEFEVSANCADAWSGWSAPFTFITDGCCQPPGPLSVSELGSYGCLIAWPDMLAANGYVLRYKAEGEDSWQSQSLLGNGFELADLQPCTNYMVQAQTLCDTGLTAFSPILTFQTGGCGACLDVAYCPAAAGQASGEWIAELSIGPDWTYQSGAGGSGYQNLTGAAMPALVLHAQGAVPITISPGFLGTPTKQFFRVYLDANMDGDFEDAGELVFGPNFAHDGPMSGLLTVPDFQEDGLTRMRVMMKFRGLSGAPPQPCESFDFGQVEDYCVQLQRDSTPSSSIAQRQLPLLSIFPQPAVELVHLQFPEDATGEWQVSVHAADGRQMFWKRMPLHRNQQLHLDTKYWPSGIYSIRAQQAAQRFWGKVVKL